MAKCKIKKMAMGGMGTPAPGAVNPLAGKQIPTGQGGAPVGTGGPMPRPGFGGQTVQQPVRPLPGGGRPAPMPMPGGAKPTMGPNPMIQNARPMKKGGAVSSASKRADGIAQKGKTRGKVC